MSDREKNEIILAVFYANALGHGTAGHNRLMLIARMAKSSDDIRVKNLVNLATQTAEFFNEVSDA